MFKINDIKSAICSRKSCRNFQHRRIDVTIKEQLSFLLSNKLKGICRTEISFELIERPLDNSKEMKLTYGLLRGHNAYILAKIKPSKTARIDYGYLLEGIALKVQELGLASCWVGYFDQDYFPEIKLNDSEMIPSILVVGYPNDSFFLGGKIAEIVSGRAKRKEWKELFIDQEFMVPLEPQKSGIFHQPFEMVRLAPSAGNKQPWRIMAQIDDQKVHFYKKIVSTDYEKRGLHDIDLGICIAHFDLMVKKFGLKGKWSKKENYPKHPSGDFEYMVSWET